MSLSYDRHYTCIVKQTDSTDVNNAFILYMSETQVLSLQIDSVFSQYCRFVTQL